MTLSTAEWNPFIVQYLDPIIFPPLKHNLLLQTLTSVSMDEDASRGSISWFHKGVVMVQICTKGIPDSDEDPLTPIL